MRFARKRSTESADPAPATAGAPARSEGTQVAQARQPSQQPSQQDQPAAEQESAPAASAQATDTKTQQPEQQSEQQPEAQPEQQSQKQGEQAAAPERKPAPAKAAPGKAQAAEEKPKGQTGAKLAAGANALRSRIANIVWLVAVVCALLLAVGALLVALKMNQDNAIVAFVVDMARTLDFGTFKEFTGKNAGVKSALVNWGIAAVIYLVAGKILDRLIRP